MGYRDVTDRSAVEAALEEFDLAGRRQFLNKYGFGTGLDYFLVENKRSYDAKAILGAAHQYQHGVALQHGDFSGGVATAEVLAKMGFRVEGPLFGDWNTVAGSVVQKSLVKQLYGGTIYGGIEPSTTTSNVLIYSAPSEGVKYGYNFDGWSVEEPDVFYYTGEGQHGDQSLTHGNLQLLKAEEKGRSIRLFEAAGPRQPGGRPYRYVGEVYVDPTDPYRREDAPDQDGNVRSVLVFKLRRVGFVDGVVTSPPKPNRPSHDGSVTIVPPEDNRVDAYQTAGRAGGTATRPESGLMRKLEDFLLRQNHEVGRLRIVPRGHLSSMVTDTFDITAGVLYEIKASAARTNVRMAIGQLLDYARYAPPGTSLSAVFPVRPAEDLVGLLSLHRIGLVYVESGAIELRPISN